MPASIRLSRRLALALLSGLLLVTVGAGGALAQSMPPVTGDGATPAVPDPTVTGAQPIPFDHVVVGPDGRTLVVYYWHGAEGCYGLKDVEVAQVEGGIAITIWAGMRADAVSTICIESLQLYSTQVVLDQPLIVNGGLD